MAINVQKYIKNVGKSVAYSAADVLNEKFKFVDDFKTTNQEVFKEAYAGIKDYKTTFARVKKTITNNKIIDAARVGMDSIVYSVTTGDFYSKQREDEINLKYGGLDATEDWDIDSEDFDWDNDDLSTGDKIVATAIKKNSKLQTAFTSEAIVKTGKAQIDANRDNTVLLYTQNERMMSKLGGGLDNIFSFMKQTGERNDKIQQKQIENQNKFMSSMENSMNKVTSQLDELLKLQKNLYNPEKTEEKKRTGLYEDLVNSNGVIDIKEYLKVVKKNTYSTVDQMSGGMLSQMFGDMLGKDSNMLATMVATPLRSLMTAGINGILGKDFDKASKDLNKTLSGIIPSLMSKASGASKKESGISKILGQIFGVKFGDSSTDIDTSKYNKGAIPFDGITKITITDVIPYYLRKMTSFMTGGAEEYYDYTTGSWKKMNALKKEYDDLMNSKKNQGAGYLENIITRRMGRSLENTFAEQKDIDKIREYLKEIASDMASNGATTVLSDRERYSGEKDEVLKTIRAALRDEQYDIKKEENKKGKIVTKIGNETGLGKSLISELDKTFIELNESFMKNIKSINEDSNNSLRRIVSEGISTNRKYSGSSFLTEHGDIDISRSPMAQALRSKDEYGYTVYDYLRYIRLDLNSIKFNTSNIVPLQTDENNNDENNSNTINNNQIEDDMIKNIKQGTNSKKYEDNNWNQGKRNKKKNDDKLKESHRTHIQELQEKFKENKGGYDKFASSLDYKNENQDAITLSYIMAEQDVKSRAKKIKEAAEKKTLSEKSLKKLNEYGIISQEELKELSNLDYDNDKTISENLKKAKGVKQTLYILSNWIGNKVIAKPRQVATETIMKVDHWLQKLIWGEDTGDKENKKSIGERIKDGFKSIGDKIKDGFEKIKDKINNNEKFQNAKNKIKEFFIGTREDSEDTYSGGIFGNLIGSIQKHLKQNSEDVAAYMKEQARLAKEAVDKLKSKSDNNEIQTTYTETTSEELARRKAEMELRRKLTNTKYHKIRDRYIDRIGKNTYDKNRIINRAMTDGRSSFNTSDRILNTIRERVNNEENDQQEYLTRQERKDKKYKEVLNNINISTKKIKNLIKEKKNISKEIPVIDDYIRRNKNNPEELSKYETKKQELENRIIEINKELETENKEREKLRKIIKSTRTMATGGINKTGKPFLSAVSSGELINGKVVPPGGPYITTIPNNATVVNPAPKAIRNIQAKQENKLVNKIRQNAEANDGLENINEEKAPPIKIYSDKMELTGDAVSRGLLGGAGGLLLGFPGIGMILGAGSAFAKRSNGFANALFGEATKLDESGNVVERNDDGIISQEIQKAVPDVKKFGLGGALAGLLTPFGPVGGMLIGSAIGFAKNNSTIQEELFGENGIIGKEKIDKLKKALPKMGIGVVAGSLLGPFGIVGNAILGATAGYVTSTDKFKQMIFGHDEEIIDKDGKITTKKVGGLVGALKDGIEPLKSFGRIMIDSILDATFGVKGKDGKRQGGLFGYTKDLIVKPIMEGIKPILKEGKNVITDLGQAAKGAFNKFTLNAAGKNLTGSIANTSKKIGKAAVNIGKAGLMTVGSPLMLGAQGVKLFGRHLRKKQIRNGRADDMTANERLNFRGQYGVGKNDDFGEFDFRLAQLDDSQDTINKLELLKTQIGYATKGQQSFDENEKKLRNELGQEFGNYLEYGDRKRLAMMVRDKDFKGLDRMIKAGKFKGKGKDITDEQRKDMLSKVEKYKEEMKEAEKRNVVAKAKGKIGKDELKEYGLDKFDISKEADVTKVQKYLEKEIAHRKAGLTPEEIQDQKMRKSWEDRENPINKLNETNKSGFDRVVEALENLQQNAKYKEDYSKLSEDEKIEYGGFENYKNLRKLNEVKQEKAYENKKLNKVNNDKLQSQWAKMSDEEREQYGNEFVYYKKYVKKFGNPNENKVNKPKENDALSEAENQYYSEYAEKIIKEAESLFDKLFWESELQNIENYFKSLDENIPPMYQNECKTGKEYFDRYVQIYQTETKPFNYSKYNQSPIPIICRKFGELSPESIEVVQNAKKQFVQYYLSQRLPKGKTKKGILSKLLNKLDITRIRKGKLIKFAAASALLTLVPGGAGVGLGVVKAIGAAKGIKKLATKAHLGNKLKWALGDHEPDEKYNKKLEKKFSKKWDKLDEEERQKLINKYTSKGMTEEEAYKAARSEFINEGTSKKKGLIGNIKSRGLIGGIKNTVKSGVQNAVAGVKGFVDKKKEKAKEQDNFLNKFFKLYDKHKLAKEERKKTGEDGPIKKILKKIFGAALLIGGVPLLTGFMQKTFIPILKNKVGPWFKKTFIGEKNANGEYEGGLVSGIVKPIKNFFGDKFKKIHDWFANEGEYSAKNKGMSGLIENFKKFGLYLVDTWKVGTSTIINDFVPKFTQTFVKNIIPIAGAIVKGLWAGVKDLFFGNKKNDGSQDLDSIGSNTLGSEGNSTNSSNSQYEFNNTVGGTITVESPSKVNLGWNDTIITNNKINNVDVTRNNDGTETATNEAGESVTTQKINDEQMRYYGTNESQQKLYMKRDGSDTKTYVKNNNGTYTPYAEMQNVYDASLYGNKDYDKAVDKYNRSTEEANNDAVEYYNNSGIKGWKARLAQTAILATTSTSKTRVNNIKGAGNLIKSAGSSFNKFGKVVSHLPFGGRVVGGLSRGVGTGFNAIGSATNTLGNVTNTTNDLYNIMGSTIDNNRRLKNDVLEKALKDGFSEKESKQIANDTLVNKKESILGNFKDYFAQSKQTKLNEKIAKQAEESAISYASKNKIYQNTLEQALDSNITKKDAKKIAQEAEEKAMEAFKKKYSEAISDGMSKKAAKRLAQETMSEAEEGIIDSVVKKGTKKIAKEATEEAAETAIEKGIKNISNDIMENNIDKLATHTISNVAEDATEKGARSLAQDVTEEAIKDVADPNAIKGIKKILDQIAKKLPDALQDLFKNKGFKQVIGEKIAKKWTSSAGVKMCNAAVKEWTEYMAKECSEKGAKKASKAAFKSVVAAANAVPFAQIVSLIISAVFVITDFITGWNNAGNILQISNDKVTFTDKLLASMIRGIQSLLTALPGVGIFFTALFLLLNEQIVATGIIKAFNSLVNFVTGEDSDIMKRREESQAELAQYNQDNNTNLSFEQWNNREHATTYSKLVGKLYTAGSWAFGKDQQTVEDMRAAKYYISSANNIVQYIKEKLGNIVGYIWEHYENKILSVKEITRDQFVNTCTRVIDKIVILLNQINDEKKLKEVKSSSKKMSGTIDRWTHLFPAFNDAWDDPITYLKLSDKIEISDTIKCVAGLSSVFVKSCGGAGLKWKIVSIVVSEFGDLFRAVDDEQMKKIIEEQNKNIKELNNDYNDAAGINENDLLMNTNSSLSEDVINEATTNDKLSQNYPTPDISTNANTNDKLTKLNNTGILKLINPTDLNNNINKIIDSGISVLDLMNPVNLANIIKGKLPNESKTDSITESIKNAISNITGGLENIPDIINNLQKKNLKINESIDKLNILPTDKKYWDIEVDEKNPFASGLFRFTESINRVIKAPFALSATALGGGLEVISSNTASTTTAASSAGTAAGNTISKNSTTSTNTTTGKTVANNNSTKSTNVFKKIAKSIGSLFGKGKDDDYEISEDSGLGDPYHIYQRDYNTSFNVSGDSERQSLADSGCGPAAAASLLRMYGKKGDMNTAAKYALNNNYKEVDGGTYPQYFQDYLGKNGIATNAEADNADVINSLAENKPVVLMGKDSTNSGKTPYGSKYSHYVVARGLDEKGNVIVEDSEDKRGGTKYSLAETLKNSSVKITTGSGKYGRANESLNEHFTNKVNAFITGTVGSVIASAINSTNGITKISSNTNNKTQDKNSNTNGVAGSLTTTTDIKTSCGYTAEQLTQGISSVNANCAALNYVDAVINLENKYGINALFALSVPIIEQGWNGIEDRGGPINTTGANWGNYNVFNIEGPNTSNGRWKDYSSYTDAFEGFGSLMESYYNDYNLHTVKEVGSRYCPDNDQGQGWAEGVCGIADMIVKGIKSSGSGLGKGLMSRAKALGKYGRAVGIDPTATPAFIENVNNTIGSGIRNILSKYNIGDAVSSYSNNNRSTLSGSANVDIDASTTIVCGDSITFGLSSTSLGERAMGLSSGTTDKNNATNAGTYESIFKSKSDIISGASDAIFFWGMNEVHTNMSVEAYADQYEDSVKTILGYGGKSPSDTKVYVLSVIWVPDNSGYGGSYNAEQVKEFNNKYLKPMATSKGYTYVDIFEETKEVPHGAGDVHPSNYQKLYEIIKKAFGGSASSTEDTKSNNSSTDNKDSGSGRGKGNNSKTIRKKKTNSKQNKYHTNISKKVGKGKFGRAVTTTTPTDSYSGTTTTTVINNEKIYPTTNTTTTTTTSDYNKTTYGPALLINNKESDKLNQPIGPKTLDDTIKEKKNTIAKNKYNTETGRISDISEEEREEKLKKYIEEYESLPDEEKEKYENSEAYAEAKLKEEEESLKKQNTGNENSKGLISLLGKYVTKASKSIFGPFYDALFGEEKENNNTDDNGGIMSGDADKYVGYSLSSTDEFGNTRTLKITQDEADCFNALAAEGLGAPACCGAIGNFEAECGQNRLREIATRGQITYGGGLMQWTPPSKHIEWASKNGFSDDPWCWEANVKHMVDEVKTGGMYSRATSADPSLASQGLTAAGSLEEFKQLTDPESAAASFERIWECSGDWNGRNSEGIVYGQDRLYDKVRREYAKLAYAIICEGKGTKTGDENSSGSGRGKDNDKKEKDTIKYNLANGKIVSNKINALTPLATREPISIYERAKYGRKYGRGKFGRALDDEDNSTTTIPTITTTNETVTNSNSTTTEDNVSTEEKRNRYIEEYDTLVNEEKEKYENAEAYADAMIKEEESVKKPSSNKSSSEDKSLLTKLTKYAVKATKMVYGPVYEALFGEEESTNSDSDDNTAIHASGEPVYAAAMVFEANQHTNPNFIYQDWSKPTLTCKDGTKIEKVLSDCSGMMTATVQYMGYYTPKWSGEYSETFHGDNMCVEPFYTPEENKHPTSIKNGDGQVAQEFTVMNYPGMSGLQAGDILIYQGHHVEMYVYTDTNGVPRGFNAGSSDGMRNAVPLAEYIIENGGSLPDPSTCMGSYLSADTYFGSSGAQLILRYSNSGSGRGKGKNVDYTKLNNIVKKVSKPASKNLSTGTDGYHNSGYGIGSWGKNELSATKNRRKQVSLNRYNESNSNNINGIYNNNNSSSGLGKGRTNISNYRSGINDNYKYNNYNENTSGMGTFYGGGNISLDDILKVINIIATNSEQLGQIVQLLGTIATNTENINTEVVVADGSKNNSNNVLSTLSHLLNGNNNGQNIANQVYKIAKS